MSTLRYIDPDGSVRFWDVPWKTLNTWLSHLNGKNVTSTVPAILNRGKVIEELEGRAKNSTTHTLSMKRIATSFLTHGDGGFGRDWRDYENNNGFTHLEELLIHQPPEWRKQAREYIYHYSFDINRISTNVARKCKPKFSYFCTAKTEAADLTLSSTLLTVLFHPEIPRTKRYEPLNFLLAYAEKHDFSDLVRNVAEEIQSTANEPTLSHTHFIEWIRQELSPLDYFFDFQSHTATFSFEKLKSMSENVGLPRLLLIKELDFSKIIGQRIAKEMIRTNVVNWIFNRTLKDHDLLPARAPLSMIFAGPSGIGKTELAIELANLLNKPSDEAFLKVDCGKLRDANELFGMAGAYQGAHNGSALNNFVVLMSKKPKAIGVVLMDEIEKASRDAIHGLYQVIDKGEWTDKRLGSRHEADEESQTKTVSCANLIFVFTTNVAQGTITNFVSKSNNVYTSPPEKLFHLADEFERRVRSELQLAYPFTDAFMGRVDAVVPFSPLACGDENESLLLGEMMTIAKHLIEREQEKLTMGNNMVEIEQTISPETKQTMAEIVVSRAVRESGVRSIQKSVGNLMGKRMTHSFLLETGGIDQRSSVEYFANKRKDDISFKMNFTRTSLSEVKESITQSPAANLF